MQMLCMINLTMNLFVIKLNLSNIMLLLHLFSNIINGFTPQYLRRYMPSFIATRNPKRRNMISSFVFRTNYFKYYFFPYCVNEWNKLDPEIRELKSSILFKRSLLRFIRPISTSIYNIIDPFGLKILTRLRVGLSHLK